MNLTVAPISVLLLFVNSAPAARAERRLALLEELAEIGMALARDVKAEAARAADAGEGAGDLGLRFARIARAVRQTLALEAHLEAGLADELARAQARETARALAARDAQAGLGQARRRRACEVVEDLFRSEASPAERPRLERELWDWLEAAPEAEAFAELPVGEIVLAICRDLGLSPDWSRWPDEAWAAEAAAAARGDPPAAGSGSGSVSGSGPGAWPLGAAARFSAVAEAVPPAAPPPGPALSPALGRPAAIGPPGWLG